MEIRMTRKSDTPEQAQNRRPTYALNSLEWGLKREIPFQMAIVEGPQKRERILGNHAV